MANRENIGKLLQELRGFAEITNRRIPALRERGGWATMRPPVIQAFVPRKRLYVTGHPVPAEPQHVAIRHV